jgi:hypothetical protein
VLVAALATACGRSTSLPSGDRSAAPTTVAVPSDPAKSPVFDAPREGDPEEFDGAQTVTKVDPAVDRIPAAVAAVTAHVGPNPELAAINVDGSSVEIDVRKSPGSKLADRYVYNTDDGSVTQYPPIPVTANFFRLGDTDLGAPGRLVPAMQQRRPGYAVNEVDLVSDGAFGLHWEFTGSDQLHFVTFVASPSGEVWAAVS